MKAALSVLSFLTFGMVAGIGGGLAQQEIQLLITEQTEEVKLPKPDFSVYNQYGLVVYHNELKTVLIGHPPDYIYTLRERALKRAEDLLVEGQIIYQLPRKPLVYINWGQINDNAATAHCEKFELFLNEILFIRHPEKFMREIIPHEVAHLIHKQKYGIGDYYHLPTFHDIMKSLVGFSTTTHDMDVQPVCDFLYELTKAQARMHPCDNCTLVLAAPFCEEEMVATVYQHKILESPYGYVVEELQ